MNNKREPTHCLSGLDRRVWGHAKDRCEQSKLTKTSQSRNKSNQISPPAIFSMNMTSLQKRSKIKFSVACFRLRLAQTDMLRRR